MRKPAIPFTNAAIAFGAAGFFFMASLWFLASSANSQKVSVRLVNLSARQSMLCQRVALLSLQLSHTSEKSDQIKVRAALWEATSLLEKTNAALSSGEYFALSAGLKKVFFSLTEGVEPRVKAFVDLAKPLAQGTASNEARAVRSVMAAQAPLLRVLEQAVVQFERESEDGLVSLKNRQSWILIFVFVSLIVAGGIGFGPGFLELQRAMEQLQDKIDAFKKKQKMLLESEARFRLFSQRSSEAVVLGDGNAIVDANDGFQMLFGYVESEIRGLQKRLLFTSDAMTAKLRSSSVHDVTAARKNGSSFEARVTAFDTVYRGKQVWGLVIRDISELSELLNRKSAQTTFENGENTESASVLPIRPVPAPDLLTVFEEGRSTAAENASVNFHACPSEVRSEMTFDDTDEPSSEFEAITDEHSVLPIRKEETPMNAKRGNTSPAIDPGVWQTLRDLEDSSGSNVIEALIPVFFSETGKKLSQLAECGKNRDFTKVSQLAHTLKSSAANMGALTLSKLLVDIERAAQKNDSAVVMSKALDATQEFGRAKEEITALVTTKELKKVG